MIHAPIGQRQVPAPAASDAAAPLVGLQPDLLCERPSPAACALRARLRAVARSPTTVVSLYGPPGAGKRAWARWLHQQASDSRSACRSWIEVHCGALAPHSAHTALFGDRHGPPGALARARGGTLFLREICHLPSTVQAHLACALEAQANSSAAAEDGPRTLWRTVASCRQHPAVQLEGGRLREDLYDQLSVFCQPVPGLCDSREDIEPLAHFFVARLSQARQLPLRPLGADAVLALRGQPLRGNVRELRGIIERALVVASGPRIGAADVSAPAAPHPRRGDAFFSVELDAGARPYPLDHVVREYVARVLQHSAKHRTAAAEILGISYPTFLKRLREMGLHDA